MTERELSAVPAEGLVALTAFNLPVYQSYSLLVDLVRQRLGERHASSFARPQLSQGRLTWTSSAVGPIRVWQTLNQLERATLDPLRASLGNDLAALADRLVRAGINTREGNLGHLLHTAMEIPSDAHLYAVGDQPVLTFWGFRSSNGMAIDPFRTQVPAAPRPPHRRLLPWLLLLPSMLALAFVAWLFLLRPLAHPRVEKPAAPPLVVNLPADRWDRHDLALLKGCWSLGKAMPATLTEDLTNITHRGVTRAGKICFDGTGHGQRTSEQDFSGVSIICTAPIIADFNTRGQVTTSQPRVMCRGGGSIRWDARSMICTRRSDQVADCLEPASYGSRPFEFRRMP